MAEKKMTAADPFARKETVFLPRAAAGESRFQYVSVNGRSYLIPKRRAGGSAGPDCGSARKCTGHAGSGGTIRTGAGRRSQHRPVLSAGNRTGGSRYGCLF